jgi:signal transduction histidine kinase
MTNSRSPSRIIPIAFPGITPTEVDELISISTINNYPSGTILCRENNLEQTFYMILEGEADVSKIVNNTESRLLKTLGAGDFFGEMALIHNAPRAASVVAKSPLMVLELNKDGFDRVLHRSSSVAMAMVKEISSRLRQNDDMAIEDLRLRAGELAEAYQKMAEQEMARREFLTNVAHELRTPLMAASGYLQIMQKGVLTADKLNEVLNTVSRNIDQIVTLVNNILFLQEIDLVLPDFQPVDVVKITETVIENYSKKAEDHHIRIKLNRDRMVPPAVGDPKSLERALTALIDNAIKFSPHGGDVNIKFGTENGALVLSVEDHGIGIATTSLPHIFDRFYHIEQSGDDLFGGLGIGLSITRQVIEQHRGKIEVESRLGHGSTFTLFLQTWMNEKQKPQ